VTALAPHPPRRRGAVAEWARGFALASRARSPIFIWIPLASIFVVSARMPWGLFAFFIFAMSAAMAHGYQRTEASRLAYLAALPLRVSHRALVLLPHLALIALSIAAEARWRHHAALPAVALAGCCAWAFAMSSRFPIRRWADVPASLAVTALAPLACALAVGGGDRGQAITGVAMGALGIALAPRWPRPRLARATSEVPLQGWAPAAPAAPFRPRRRVGVRTLFRMSIPRQSGWGLALIVGLQGLLSLIVGSSLTPRGPNPAWMMSALPLGAVLASATSRRGVEFLASRPLGLRRVLTCTVLPWLALALFVPFVAFLRERSAGARSHEMSARMALMALCFVLLGGVDASNAASPASRRLSTIAGLAPLALIPLTMWSLPPFGLLPQPPLWSLAALALASALAWILRGPWRRLALAS
jgi:hypothetical protein